MWGLSVTKREDSIDNECINLTAFKASKVDVDKDPLDVISQLIVVDNQEFKKGVIDANGRESYIFSFEPKNPLYTNTQLTIIIPASSSWSPPEAGKTLIKCTSGCRTESKEWTSSSFDDLTYETNLEDE